MDRNTSHLLDFGLDHVTWFGQWDISGHDTSRDLECSHMVEFGLSCFCHQHEKTLFWLVPLALRNGAELNPTHGLEPSPAQLSLDRSLGMDITGFSQTSLAKDLWPSPWSHCPRLIPQGFTRGMRGPSHQSQPVLFLASREPWIRSHFFGLN